MNTNNLMSCFVEPANRVTIQDLPTGLVELWEKDLEHIVGGCDCPCDYTTWFKNQPPAPPLNLPKPRWLSGNI